MKRILCSSLLAGLLLFGLSRPVSSQGTTFAIHFDPLLCWFSSDQQASNDGARLGIRTGLEIDRFFAPRYAFNTGLLFQQTGGALVFADSIPVRTASATDTLPPGTALKYRLQHVGVPLGLKFKTDEIGYLTFYFNLGLLPQIRVKAESMGEPESLVKADIREEVPWLSLNYFFGAGAEYSLGGSTALIFGISFQGGLLNSITRDPEEVHAKIIGIKAGILF